MCDTVVAGVWFAKNSDREPSEPQVVEQHDARTTGHRLRCTHIVIDDVERTNAITISRPIWMWGAEMGFNARGVAIGNEAVFTRLPVANTGLTGMDLVRLGLERGDTAIEALDIITSLLAEYGQGGRCGYRNKRFVYHNAFLIADATQAWVLETAGPYWAAQHVDGPRTISNVLSIGERWDRIGPGTIDFARRKGWFDGKGAFSFRDAFASRWIDPLTGGRRRAACTLRAVSDCEVDGATMRAALREHGSADPSLGWRSAAPCAHAGWMPTRHSAQTTGSMIARLDGADSRAWFTGTSSPCMSVFKPLDFDHDLRGRIAPTSRFDDSLWWRHERLHRRAILAYERTVEFARERTEFEASVFDASPDADHWSTHAALADRWAASVADVRPPRRLRIVFWKMQDVRDRI